MRVFCPLLRYSAAAAAAAAAADDDDDDASELGLIKLHTFHFVPCFKNTQHRGL
jgi:hypothetical protein